MIQLPKKDKEGRYFLSYSQYDLWRQKKGFNTGLPGKQEYILKYFLNEKFPDKTGYATFGSECESYICNKENEDKFLDYEKEILNNIIPLGTFQYEIKYDFDDFYIWGFIDDMTSDMKKIRDYKTASRSSGKKYETDEYEQMDVYAGAINQITGNIPEIEICCIGREGNGFRGGRNVLKVIDDIWYIKRETTIERIKNIENKIRETAEEISDYYKIYTKLNTI